MGEMADFSKLVLFGSFTEEETRKYQKKAVNVENASIGMTCLQFGSLDFNTVISSKDPKPEVRDSDLSQKSQSSSSSTSSSITKDDVQVIKNLPKKVKAKELCGPQANGSIEKYHQSQSLTDNGKLETKLNLLSISRDKAIPSAAIHEADVYSSKDITESSSESEFYINSPVAVNSNEESPRRNAQKSLNVGTVAIKPLLPCGLINSGNLCFLNATLQALLSCTPFVQLLQNLRASDVPKTGYPTVHAFVEFISNFDMPDGLLSKMNDSSVTVTGTTFIPSMFEAVLNNFTPDLQSSMSSRPRQEDAQEFLGFVMDRFHDELLKLDGHFSNSSGGLSSLVSSQDDDGWETVGPRNKSAVTRIQSFTPSELSDIFGGQLRSVVKAKGTKASATVQPFLLLHLDILSDAVTTIQDALHLFSIPVALEGYRSSGSKAGVVSASKTVKIQKPSKIMILHLMRFSYDSKGSAKLHKPVHFPLEFVLGRELFVSPTSEGRKYELVATITHHGRHPSKGHYTADTRYSNGRWLRYDDASVTMVPTSEVLHDQAYVLFYKQV